MNITASTNIGFITQITKRDNIFFPKVSIIENIANILNNIFNGKNFEEKAFLNTQSLLYVRTKAFFINSVRFANATTGYLVDWIYRVSEPIGLLLKLQNAQGI